MRHAIAVALLCLFSVFVFGQVEQQITKMEQDWGVQLLTSPAAAAAAVEKYEAEDIINIGADGVITTKVQDKEGFLNGDVKMESSKATDLKVQSFGEDVAVATAISTVKGSYKGKDMSGTYRWADTWVKRNGKWQVVASAFTKVEEQK